jgi:RimJ/RimL family protein N-acetyltransferase
VTETLPGPIIVTQRLELWRPQVGDLPGQMAMMTPERLRAHLGANTPDAPNQFARLLRNAGSWSLYGYGVFTVRLRGEPAIVGGCGVFQSWRGLGKGFDDAPEAGWIVAIEHWGKGIAQEAMRASLEWFDRRHGPRRVVCMIEQGNVASHRVAAKLGFMDYDRHTLEDGSEVLLYER